MGSKTESQTDRAAGEAEEGGVAVAQLNRKLGKRFHPLPMPYSPAPQLRRHLHVAFSSFDWFGCRWSGSSR